MSTEPGITHADIVALVAWMAEQEYTPHQIADAVAKPWHYRDEIAAATATPKGGS